MATLRIQDVTKHAFENKYAMKHVSFTVPHGSFVVLTGPAASGKTALLRMTAGLEQPDNGDFFIGDQCVTDLPALGRDVSMLSQNETLFTHLTAYHNITIGMLTRGIGEEEQRPLVAEIARLLGIEDILEQRPTDLSRMQRKRLTLARALVRNPGVLLLDEPFAGLDPVTRRLLRAEFREICRKRNATVLFATRDFEDILPMADQIVVMRDGAVEQVGAPRALIDNPNNRFVAGFLEKHMNFLDGKLDGRAVAVCGTVIPLDQTVLPSTAKVTLGIRPDSILVNSGSGGELAGHVRMGELVGKMVHLHIDCGDVRLIAAVPPDFSYKAEQRVTLHLQPHHVHLFHPKSGELLA